MNRDQINYLRDRIKAIYKEKTSSIILSLKIVPNHMDYRKRLDYIIGNKNKVKLKDRSELTEYINFVDAYILPLDVEIEKIKKENDKRQDQLIENLKNEFNRIMDQIMLGSLEESLKMIEFFEKLKVT